MRWQRPKRLPYAAGAAARVANAPKLLTSVMLAILLRMLSGMLLLAQMRMFVLADAMRWTWSPPPVFHCAVVQFGDPVRPREWRPPEPSPRTVPVYGDPDLSGKTPVHHATVAGGSTSVKVLPQHARPPDDAQRWAAENVITSLPAGIEYAPPDVAHTRDEEHGWIFAKHPAFSEEDTARLRQVFIEHKDAFAYSTDMPGYSGMEPPFEIKGEGFKTTRRSIARNRPLSPAEREVLDKTCAELLQAGIIEMVPTSNYISMPLLPAKKDEHGNWTQRRMAIDYRHISALGDSDRDHYGLPLAWDLFQRIGINASIYTKLDCRSGFHQIPVAEEDRDKTAFWWGNKIARWKRMPFGLRNAPAKFQRIMDSEIAARGLSEFCFCFVDDLVIASSSPAEHVEHVRRVLQMLREINMKAHPMKTLVGADRVEYLGHYVSQYGMTPLDAKIAAIKSLPTPTNVDTLRSALGVIGYYRCYVPNFSVIAAPLTGLFKKNTAWKWGEEQQKAWDELVRIICYGNKALRRADPSRPYILHTDWSGVGIGAILGQVDDDGNEYMVACASRTCNVHEKRYAPYYGEMLAAVWAVKTFRVYLHGAPKFKLVTDHQPLTYLMNNPNLTGQHARWALALQEYDFEIVHRPGVTHQNADGLSRMPLATTVDGTGACLDPEPYSPSLCLALWSATKAPTPREHQEQTHACTVRMVTSVGDSVIDVAAPKQDDLLAGNLGLATDEFEYDPSDSATVLTAQWGDECAHAAAASGACGELRSEPSPSHTVLNSSVASAATTEEAGLSSPDVWGDRETMHLVQQGQHLPGSSLAARKRAAKRARSYVWTDSKLFRKFWDGSKREVPPPDSRASLVYEFHGKTGLFGSRRTAHLLRQRFWWVGLDADVRTVVRSCQLCERVNASFTATTDTLNPLPLEGMFFRWGVDLAGPFPATKRGSKYVMICIDHWSKVVEVLPLPDKTAACTAYAFKTAVLARYGSCAECLTDGGQEWRGEFETLLEQCFVDHRVTSPAHPQTNGCAERCVQTVKRALRKHCELAGSVNTWDEHLPWIQLAYNCSVQSSTKLSPYLMLYAHLPVVPPAIVQRMAEPLDLEDAESAQQALRSRAQLMEQCAIVAGNNLRIAQHRDTLRYAMTHSGAYKPRLRKFLVGDFVYLRVGQKRNTLEVPAQQLVLRVAELRPSGIAVLQGRCGARMSAHISSLAPCHLPDIDPTLDLSLLRPSADMACEVCNSPERAESMLLCDGCNTGWHMQCLDPPLKSVPVGEWLCPTCVQLGVRPQAKEDAPTPAVKPKRLFKSKSQRDAAARAAQLDGSTVVRAMRTGKGKQTRLVNVIGKLKFLGPEHSPRFFLVEYENGAQEHMTFAMARRSLAAS